MEKTINCDVWKKKEKLLFFPRFKCGENYVRLMKKCKENIMAKDGKKIEENTEVFLVKICVGFRVSCDGEIPSPLAFGLFDGI